MKIYLIFLLFLIFIIPSDLYSVEEMADVIYLKNGRKIGGKIIEKVPGDYVVLELANGLKSTFIYDDIEKIEQEPLSDSTFNKKIKHSFVGMSFGAPAVFNFNCGHWFDMFGMSLSGGLWGDKGLGIQINGGIKVFDNGRISHSFMAVFGMSSLRSIESSDNSIFFSRIKEESKDKEYLDWNYVGVVYDLFFGVFFIELGISAGSGVFSNPQTIFQGGFRFRF